MGGGGVFPELKKVCPKCGQFLEERGFTGPSCDIDEPVITIFCPNCDIIDNKKN